MNEAALGFAALAKKQFDVQQMLLFGSRARGDSLKSSDYDFIIVLKDFEKFDFLDRVKEVFKRTGAFINADLLCYSPAEFEKKKKQIGTVRTAVKEAVAV